MRDITHLEMVDELNDKFWYDWTGQKQKVYEIAKNLLVHYEYEPSEAIEKAYKFVSTFREEVMDSKTRKYFN